MHQKLLKLVRDTALKCSKVNCDIKADIDSLKVFTDQNKDYDYCRNVFIYYPMVFNSLHKLQLEEFNFKAEEAFNWIKIICLGRRKSF